MPAFGRDQKRFVCLGLSVNGAPDALQPGKYPFLQNVRSDLMGVVGSRTGSALLTTLGGLVHSVYRLSDLTPFSGAAARYFFGVGGSLFSGPPAGPFTSIDSGYSGNPLSLVALEPPSSPKPWLYVSDASRSRKINSSGTVYPIGIASPTAEALTEMFTIGVNLIANFNTGFSGYSSIGDAATALTTIDRVNTTIDRIVYDGDSGILGGEGNCTIAPVDPANITEGMMLLLDGVDLVQVAQITVPVADTTIAAIIYDSGSTGWCTIQPAASLGTGLLDMPRPGDNVTTSGRMPDNLPHQSSPEVGHPIGQAVPRHPGLPGHPDLAGVPNAGAIWSSQDPNAQMYRSVRQQDFPVNAIVELSGSETVRIFSVAVGRDEIQSFRCFTSGTHAAGGTIEGITGFRAWVPNVYAPGDAIYDGMVHHEITPVLAEDAAEDETQGTATAGIVSAVVAQNLAQLTVGGDTRPILPGDDIHLQLRTSDITTVDTIRVYFDTDRVTNDFTQNYYFYEWRASDIITALHGTNTSPTATLLQAREQAAANTQVARTPSSQYGSGSPYRMHGAPIDESVYPPSTTVAGTTPVSASAPIGTGNNQWVDLQCKVSQLIHVGTDFARGLKDVQRVEVLVQVHGSVDDPIGVEYDTLYISGGYAVDIGGPEGVPYRYRYSYRSSTTGARSNPSPSTRSPVIPRRQRVFCISNASADPQCDLVDWWRMGGALTRWTYVGTHANGTTTFYDDYGDSSIDGGQSLEFDNFQPFPSTDGPRSGTCNVAGNAIRKVSGDNFNTSWAEGSNIIVNGRVYTLYGQPLSSTLLFLNESAGSGSAVPFFIPSATLVSRTFPILFGGPIGGIVFTFGLGDPLRPGSLAWTKPNTPEAASDTGFLEITPASEPLLNGCLDDGLPYVFSSEDCYVVEPDFGQPHQFRALRTQCGRGLWSQWALCPTPYGIAFLADDGICLTRGGSTALSLTDADLYPLFPHDGNPGVAVNGISPPDMSLNTRLKLSYCDGYLYFDYRDTAGTDRTLSFRFSDKSWWFDSYPSGISARHAEEGALIHQMTLGTVGGGVYTPSGIADGATAIPCRFWFTENQGDGRAQKLYRDVNLEIGAAGGTAITVQLGLTNNTVLLASMGIVTTAGRQPYYLNLNPTTMNAYGTNLTIDVSWSPSGVVPPLPLFYFYDIAGQTEPELATNWLSGPTTHGLPGFQHVPLILLCYRSLGAATFRVIIDGVTYTYSLPDTGGQYLKKMFRLQAIKGMTFQYGFLADTSAAFMLFDRDCEVWVQPWGVAGGYHKMKPFSGPDAGLTAQGPGVGTQSS